MKMGHEGIFSNKPTRGGELHFWYDEVNDGGTSYDTEIPLPKGSIKKLIGKNLTWNDEQSNKGDNKEQSAEIEQR